MRGARSLTGRPLLLGHAEQPRSRRSATPRRFRSSRRRRNSVDVRLADGRTHLVDARRSAPSRATLGRWNSAGPDSRAARMMESSSERLSPPLPRFADRSIRPLAQTTAGWRHMRRYRSKQRRSRRPQRNPDRATGRLAARLRSPAQFLIPDATAVSHLMAPAPTSSQMA